MSTRNPNSSSLSRRAAPWVVTLLIAAFVAVVIYESIRVPRLRCEICLTYRGQTACRTVEAQDESEGRTAALTTVCAVLAAGVTDTLACQRTAPDHFRCESL